MKYIDLNGKILPASEAGTDYDNRAFRYGYGLFETMLYKDGQLILDTRHWERLLSGMKQLYFALPVYMTNTWLKEAIEHIVRKNKLEKLCRVRLQVFAGSGGLYDNTSQKPEYIIECFSLDENILELNENGLVCGIAKELYKSADKLANIKSCNALIYAMAAQQAKQHKWNDALVLNTNNNIIESTIANIFIVKDQQIYTPALSEGCITGVMRRWIIDMLQKEDIAVIESAINRELLAGAEEVFLSNAIRRIKWIKNIERQNYNNEYTRHLYQILFKKEYNSN